MEKLNKTIFVISIAINIIIISAFIWMGCDYFISKQKFNKNTEVIEELGEEMFNIQTEFNEYKMKNK